MLHVEASSPAGDRAPPAPQAPTAEPPPAPPPPRPSTVGNVLIHHAGAAEPTGAPIGWSDCRVIIGRAVVANGVARWRVAGSITAGRGGGEVWGCPTAWPPPGEENGGVPPQNGPFGVPPLRPPALRPGWATPAGGHGVGMGVGVGVPPRLVQFHGVRMPHPPLARSGPTDAPSPPAAGRPSRCRESANAAVRLPCGGGVWGCRATSSPTGRDPHPGKRLSWEPRAALRQHPTENGNLPS